MPKYYSKSHRKKIFWVGRPHFSTLHFSKLFFSFSWLEGSQRRVRGVRPPCLIIPLSGVCWAGILCTQMRDQPDIFIEQNGALVEMVRESRNNPKLQKQKLRIHLNIRKTLKSCSCNDQRWKNTEHMNIYRPSHIMEKKSTKRRRNDRVEQVIITGSVRWRRYREWKRGSEMRGGVR